MRVPVFFLLKQCLLLTAVHFVKRDAKTGQKQCGHGEHEGDAIHVGARFLIVGFVQLFTHRAGCSLTDHSGAGKQAEQRGSEETGSNQ